MRKTVVTHMTTLKPQHNVITSDNTDYETGYCDNTVLVLTRHSAYHWSIENNTTSQPLEHAPDDTLTG